MKYLKTLKIIKEERLVIEELEDTPIPTQVTEMGWTHLVKTPQKINLSMVYEFYHKIKSETFREEGVLVRGVRVAFNPQNVNSFFQTQPLRDQSLGFPPHDDYQGNTSAVIAEELRNYPIGRWRGGQQKIDHRELSGHLAFWNVFVSRAVSPCLQHQTLHKDHPFIILCINKAVRMDVGVIICKSLEWHVTSDNQIVFPSTITALCEISGVREREDDHFIRPGSALGARAYNKIALSRGEPRIWAADDDRDGSSSEDIGRYHFKGRSKRVNRVDIVDIKETQYKILNILESCASRLSVIEGHLNIGGQPRQQAMVITSPGTEERSHRNEEYNTSNKNVAHSNTNPCNEEMHSQQGQIVLARALTETICGVAAEDGNSQVEQDFGPPEGVDGIIEVDQAMTGEGTVDENKEEDAGQSTGGDGKFENLTSYEMCSLQGAIAAVNQIGNRIQSVESSVVVRQTKN